MAAPGLPTGCVKSCAAICGGCKTAIRPAIGHAQRRADTYSCVDLRKCGAFRRRSGQQCWTVGTRLACACFRWAGTECDESRLCRVLYRSARKQTDGLLRTESKRTSGCVCKRRELCDGGLWTHAVDVAQSLSAPDKERRSKTGQPLRCMRGWRLPGNIYR